MRRRGPGQRVQLVPAFEERHDATVAVVMGDAHDPIRRPREIGLEQAQVGQRIVPVGVEPRRNKDEVRAEALQGGEDASLERGAERSPVVPGLQRRVADVADAAPVPGKSGIWCVEP